MLRWHYTDSRMMSLWACLLPKDGLGYGICWFVTLPIFLLHPCHVTPWPVLASLPVELCWHQRCQSYIGIFFSEMVSASVVHLLACGLLYWQGCCCAHVGGDRPLYLKYMIGPLDFLKWLKMQLSDCLFPKATCDSLSSTLSPMFILVALSLQCKKKRGRD